MKIEVDKADLEKILDALHSAKNYFVYKDKMNAETHLARETRDSPISSVVSSAYQRLEVIIERERLIADSDGAG